MLVKIRKLRIGLNRDKTRVQIRLQVSGANDRKESLEFEMKPAGAMFLMQILRQIQADQGFPIPPTIRPKAGRPKLYVVRQI